MVWKNLFNFVSERSVWAGNVQNGPNVQQSKRRRIIELLKVQVFCIQVFGWILLEGQCFFNHFSISSTFLILFFLSLALQLGQGRSEVTTKIYKTENTHNPKGVTETATNELQNLLTYEPGQNKCNSYL